MKYFLTVSPGYFLKFPDDTSRSFMCARKTAGIQYLVKMSVYIRLLKTVKIYFCRFLSLASVIEPLDVSNLKLLEIRLFS